MSRSRRLPDLLLPLASAAFLALAAPAAGQQPDAPPLTRPQFGIGYVANAPDAMAGANVYVVLPRWGGIGFYLDGKFDVSDPSDELGFDASVTAAQVEGEVGGDYVKAESSWWSVNAAIIRPLTNSFMGYVGGGIANRTYYRLYNVDPESTVGYGGVVWAEDPDAETRSANFMFGALLRLTSRITTQFGYETEPGGVTFGAGLRLPRW